MPESGHRALATWLATLLAAGLPLLALWPLVGDPLRMYLAIPWTLAFWAGLPFAAFALPALEADGRRWARWTPPLVVAGALFAVLEGSLPTLLDAVRGGPSAPISTASLVVDGAAFAGGLALLGIVASRPERGRRLRGVAAALAVLVVASLLPGLSGAPVAVFVVAQVAAAGALASPRADLRTLEAGLLVATAGAALGFAAYALVRGQVWPPRLALGAAYATELGLVVATCAVLAGAVGFHRELARAG